MPQCIIICIVLGCFVANCRHFHSACWHFRIHGRHSKTNRHRRSFAGERWGGGDKESTRDKDLEELRVEMNDSKVDKEEELVADSAPWTAPRLEQGLSLLTKVQSCSQHLLNSLDPSIPCCRHSPLHHTTLNCKFFFTTLSPVKRYQSWQCHVCAYAQFYFITHVSKYLLVDVGETGRNGSFLDI